MTTETEMLALSGMTAVVVGASRGLGQAIASSLAAAGADVIAVSRTAATFPEARGRPIQVEIADAGDAATPGFVLDRHRPDIVVLAAGASPHMVPLQQQTWQTFSANWESDVRITFHWLRQILLSPLRPGSRVVVFSSGAALVGSPLSGGYAGAKAAQRFITAYAQDEARRADLGITFSAILPRFSPKTGMGAPAVKAYAARAGQTVEEYLQAFAQTAGPLLAPETAGSAMVDLVTLDAANVAPAYLLDGGGLKKLP